ncbi:MAG: response regulator [Nitrospirae bacterium]|nr:response regulator [Nitrospirota bacterium]
MDSRSNLPKTGINILHLEDDHRFSELVQQIFAAECGGGRVTRVDTREDFEAALEAGGFDLILADYRLPGFDGESALALTREKRPAWPFILLTGAIGEEEAVECLRKGATDYILKARMERLAPAIQRAMRETRHRGELAHTQRLLLQAQKMEAIGRLAGGLAHDFNNLLTVILGETEIALADPSLPDSLREGLEDARLAADRAGSLTRRLLAFSREQALEPRVLNLNQVVSNIATMIRRLIGEDVLLAVDLDPGLGSIRADPGQMEQAILNLAVNARDAMPNGGQLRLETRNVRLDEAYAAQHPEVKAGDYAMVALTDSGVGMDAETQSHIFEPFFTTKDASKGTGLGLAMVYGFVRQSGGHIYVYSEPGLGTTAKIYLPALGLQKQKDSSAVAVEPAPGGTETVLLAEDDSMVRGFIGAALRSKGYTVLEAADGAEAVQIGSRHAGPLDLLVLDLVMPHMSGQDVAQRLKSNRPQLRVVFMSGYSSSGANSQRILPAGANYLQKPFSVEDLARIVRRSLDAHNV